MKFSKILCAGMLALSVGAFAQSAHADPVTWVMTGTLNSVNDATGTLAANGVNPSYGDPFTLTFTFDPSVGPNVSYPTYNQWINNGHSTLTLATAGGTWSGASYVDQVYNDTSWQSLVGQNYTNNYYATQYYGPAFTSNVDSGFTPHYQTSYLYFQFYGYNGPLSGTDWPSAINVADWQYNGIELYLNQYNFNTGQSAFYHLSGTITDVTVGAVPAPGALALLGLGLIGFGGLRRKLKAAEL